jgi:hypothetical protein
MTEIAIYEVRGGVVEDQYRSLVNPGRNIPRRIAVLTGISNDMVSSAPPLDHIAADVLERLEGWTAEQSMEKTGGIYKCLLEVFGLALAEDIPISRAADSMARLHITEARRVQDV